jgi:acyl carrier protein
MNAILCEKDTKAVLEILAEQLGVKESQLTPEARMEEDLGADSLTLMEIVMALDERFNISIPDESAEGVSTVADVFEMLADLLKRRTANP